MTRRLASCLFSALVVVAGCGGHGGKNGSGGSSAADPEVSIIASDITANRLVSIDDLSGSGWKTFTPAGLGPTWISVDRLGRIYFTDQNNRRIGRVDSIAGENPIFFTPSPAYTPSPFEPTGIFVDAANRITIVDGGNNQILRFDDMTGSNPHVPWGHIGTNTFAGPRGIYVRADGATYVCDYGNHRIVEFSENEPSWPSITINGSGPVSVWLDAQDRIYVCDLLNDRIVRMNDISGAGYVEFYQTSDGKTLLRPSSVFVDHASGRIYIADAGHHRIVRMDDMTGAGWTEFGTSGTGVGQFQGVWDVKVTEAPYALTLAPGATGTTAGAASSWRSIAGGG